MCDCISLIQEELEGNGSNTMLDIPFTISIKTGKAKPPRVMVATCKRDSKKRGAAMKLLATHCPFCGIPYEEAVTAVEEPRP
jgi:hypothetical protein